MSRLNVVVTVGMGPYPFDRLITAVDSIVDECTVFVQVGTSSIAPRCENRPFVPFAELDHRMRSADVVITHAGNTVRLLQRMGKVPIAMAREKRFGEMANDHQLVYLACEASRGAAVALHNPDGLLSLVEEHAETERRLLAAQSPLNAVVADALVRRLDEVLLPLLHRRSTRRPARRIAPDRLPLDLVRLERDD
jgi:UDP-N-acetylglucosamine transferase subunit ALG13